MTCRLASTYRVCEQVRPARRALTIFEKMQIVHYAEELEAKHHGLASKVPLRRVKGKKSCVGLALKPRKKKRGVDIQSLCKLKFGERMGTIKVCLLRKRAREQKWFLLPESQQRKMYSLTDEVKQALNLEASTIKGWRTWSEEAAKKHIEDKGKIQRWKVPGEVIKERYHRLIACRNPSARVTCDVFRYTYAHLSLYLLCLCLRCLLGTHVVISCGFVLWCRSWMQR